MSFLTVLWAALQDRVPAAQMTTFLLDALAALRAVCAEGVSAGVWSDEKGLELRLERPQGGDLQALRLENVELPELETSSPLAALESQLLHAQARTQELDGLQRELVDTNRGVMALVAELEEQAEKLRAGNDQKARFLRKMSQELRKPLNSVLNLSWLLLNNADGELSAEQRKQVTYIQQASAELQEMVDDIFDLTRLETGTAKVQINEFSALEVLRTLAHLARTMPRPKGVRLMFERGAAGARIRSDETKVIRILRHLLSNAIKFTREGEVRVGYAREGGSIRFSVADTGVGIPQEDFERIFEELEELGEGTSRRGAGLGLPLCRRLADLLGGSIELQSQVGEGSRFSLVIPVEPGGGGPSDEIFDRQKALRRFGDEHVLREAVLAYRQEYEGMVARLEASWASEDLHQLRETAHWVKGAVLYLQAEAAARAAADLEQRCRSGEQVESGVRRLIDELGRLQGALASW